METAACIIPIILVDKFCILPDLTSAESRKTGLDLEIMKGLGSDKDFLNLI